MICDAAENGHYERYEYSFRSRYLNFWCVNKTNLIYKRNDFSNTNTQLQLQLLAKRFVQNSYFYKLKEILLLFNLINQFAKKL